MAHMNKKESSRLKRQKAIRKRVAGTKLRPRLAVHRSLKNLCAQLIDDDTNTTLFSLSTLDKGLKAKLGYAGNVKSAVAFGQAFAAGAKEKGITKVVFDRAGFLYHGRIKAFADSLRKAGLEF